VYILGGVADFSPPALWSELSSKGEAALEAALDRGELEPLYGTSLLFSSFEALAQRAEALGLDLGSVGSVELGLSYPRELCGLSEEAAVEGFRRRLESSRPGRRLPRGVRVRLRPTVSASSSGMVPFNDGIAAILEEGCELALVVAAGNVKGTRPGRARLSAAESSIVLADLISPLERRLTGAQMLSVAAVLLARACQHDLDLVPAIAKHVREVRLSVHRRAARGLSGVHLSAHPDGYPDRVVCEPMRLMGIAPQSMGYAGLLLGARPPEAARAVRVLGVGAGIDSGALRLRADPLAARAMMAAMDVAEAQARIGDWSRLWLFEAHNAFPGVLLAELGRVLHRRGERGTVAEALLEDRAGALGQPLLVSPAGGTLAGHPITPTTVRLLGEAARALIEGHPAGLGPAEGVSYGAVSAVGGPHVFDGFFLLASGAPGELAELRPALEPFDHDALQRQVLEEQAAEAALEGVPEPGPLALVWIARSEPDRQGLRRYLGLAVDGRGRHFPFKAAAERFEELRAGRYVGLPVRLDEKLRLREGRRSGEW
jgi:hypothetical protein